MGFIKADAGRMDRIHVPFLVPALITAVFGGLSLAVSLPIQVAVGRMNLSWLSHAQVHGHLQVVGFAMLFIIGVALRIAPRFGRGSLAWSEAITPAGVLLVVGVVLRAIGQPLGDTPAFAVVMVAGATAEWLGALAFLVVFAGTLWPAVRTFQPHATFLLLSFVWFALQATVGLWWLVELAREGGTLLEHGRNGALLVMQAYGVLLCAILGVGTRTFPALFGMPAPSTAVSRVALVILNVGVSIWAVALVMQASPGRDAVDHVLAVGMVAVGSAIVQTVLMLGAGRLRHRFAPASSGFAWALQPVLVWLLLSGVVLVWLGAQALVEGTGPRADQVDAARHILFVGVVTLGIIAMGQLMLPEFASERLTHSPSRWRGPAFGVALSTAVVLRALVPLAGVDGDPRWWLMAVAGTITLSATLSFALLYWRARGRHRRYVQQLAAYRDRGPGITVLNRAGD